MKKMMIIGSVHTDLIQYVNDLPKGNEEAEVIRTETAVSGGGYSAARFLNALGFPFDVICDPGESVYGEYARSTALMQGIPLLSGSEEIGGCTLSMIDRFGNKGVFCVDGSEYHFSLAQVYDIDPDEYGAVLIYSEMLASEGSDEIPDLLNELELPVFLVLNGRTAEMKPDVFKALCAFEPAVIAADEEAYELCTEKTQKLDEAAKAIASGTCGPVILLSEEGNALYLDSQDSWIAPGKTQADAGVWAAAYCAARMAGVDSRNSMMFANENNHDYDTETMRKRLARMIAQ